MHRPRGSSLLKEHHSHIGQIAFAKIVIILYKTKKNTKKVFVLALLVKELLNGRSKPSKIDLKCTAENALCTFVICNIQGGHNAEAGRMGSMNLLGQVPVTLIHSFLKEY